MRLGGLRPQRRLLRRPASPTASATALARWPDEMPHAGAARARRTSTRSRRHRRALRHRLRLRAHRRARRGHRAVPARRAARAGRRPRRRRPRRPSCSTGDAVRAEVDSPTYLGGPVRRRRRRRWSTRPGWPGGCAGACLGLGVRIHERTRGAGLADDRRPGSACAPPYGTVRAAPGRAGHQRFPPLLRRLRPYTVPVYDYVLMTEPLTAGAARRGRLARPAGPRRRGQPVPLLPAHRRQPDPVGRLRRGLPLRQPGRPRASSSGPRRHARLAEHFFATFPQLEGLALHPRAGAGVIDTCIRFAAFFGTALRRPGRLRARLHRARRRRHPVRRRRDARPAGGRAAPSGPSCGWCAASRCRSRRAAALGRHPAHPLVAGPRRRPRAAGATSGCARSTGRPRLRLLTLPLPLSGHPRVVE